jgi:hypothetical protein
MEGERERERERVLGPSTHKLAIATSLAITVTTYSTTIISIPQNHHVTTLQGNVN